MLKEKVSLLKNMTNICSGKSSGTILLTLSNPRKTPKRFLLNTKSSFHLALHTHQENVKGKRFFSQKSDRKNSIMVTNSNSSNVISTTKKQGVNNRDMLGIPIQQPTFFSMDLNSEKSIQWESRKVHPLIKRLFLLKRIPDVPLAGTLKHFVGAWMKITQDPKILEMQNSISFKTFSVKNPFPTHSESRRGRIGETGGKRNVEEGSHQKSSTIKREVCNQLIPCKKEGWGSKTSDKREATECI